MPKNYISIPEFAERNDMSVESIKRNFKKIPGAEIIDDEYWIPESSRYPFNVGNTKLDRRENKQYVLLKATSQFKYIDEKMLKMPKVFISNPNKIYNNPASVLDFYELSEQFQCTYDDEHEEITGHLPEITYTRENGDNIILTFEDICEGFELGVYWIEEICQIKQKYGDIWNIFPKSFEE